MVSKRKLVNVGAKWNSEVRYEQRQWNNWVYRIEVEIRLANLFGYRTWFCTFTYNDLSLSRRLFTARYNPIGNAAGALESICRRDISRFLDVLRKRFKYRYIHTIEYGKIDGRIHHHVLIHAPVDVNYRNLLGWHHGFSKIKMVKDDPEKVGKYVSKYIVKQNGRIKCSLNYGLTIIRYLLSKPRLHIMSMTKASRFLKLLTRYSGMRRTPTMSLIRKQSSYLTRLQQPYEIDSLRMTQLTLMNSPTTTQPPGL